LGIVTLIKTSVLSLSVFVVVVAGFLTACHRKPDAGKVVLGPMLPTAVLPDPLSRQAAGNMRTWVENFKRSDLERLNATGRIVFAWEELQTAYPEQARMIDDYQEQRRVGIVEAIQKQSKPIPERVAAHHTPDTVEVKKSANGECWVVISSKTGIEHGFLQISAAQ
jgi:hypothetical protein